MSKISKMLLHVPVVDGINFNPKLNRSQMSPICYRIERNVPRMLIEVSIGFREP